MRHGSMLALVVLLAAGPARAGDDSIAKARARYESGVTNYNLGEYDAALVDFTEAYRLKRDPAFLFNIGQAHRQLGQHEKAIRVYRNYLREAPHSRQRADVERFIANAEAELVAKRAQEPPMGIERPAGAEDPRRAATVEPQATPALPGPVTPSPAALDTTSTGEPPRRSRTWLWASLGFGGAILVSGALGLGFGLSRGPSEPETRFGTLMPVFP